LKKRGKKILIFTTFKWGLQWVPIAVDRIILIYTREGRVEPKRRGGLRPQLLTDKHKAAIRGYIAEDCSITLDSLRDKLMETYGVEVSRSTIDRAIDCFSYTLKRVTPLPACRNDEATIELRYSYAREFLSLLSQQDGENIFFLDEVGFNASMRGKRGRAPRGQRATHVVQNLKTRNISVCCVMSKGGTFYFKKDSRAFNTDRFSVFIDELLTKFEEAGSKNMVLVMDNVPFHHSSIIGEKISAAGHSLRFLPRYSPFLNPIEYMFAQWKQLVRGSRPSNEEELISLIDSTFERISSENCSNYYRKMLDMLLRCMNREIITDE
jgi:transposase